MNKDNNKINIVMDTLGCYGLFDYDKVRFAQELVEQDFLATKDDVIKFYDILMEIPDEFWDKDDIDEIKNDLIKLMDNNNFDQLLSLVEYFENCEPIIYNNAEEFVILKFEEKGIDFEKINQFFNDKIIDEMVAEYIKNADYMTDYYFTSYGEILECLPY